MELSYIKTLKDLVAIADGESVYKPTPSRNGNIFKLPSAKVTVDLNNKGLAQGTFPILLAKKIHVESILAELFWFLAGGTNVKFLQDLGVKIWDNWADEKGDLGPIYGAQFRSATDHGVDQYRQVVEGLIDDRFSRRHVITMWSPSQLHEMALPPCHGTAIVFSVTRKEDGDYLNMTTTQRSADWYLGVPFNLTSYYLLLTITAQLTGLKVGELDYSFANVHLYENQLPAARRYLASAECMRSTLDSPEKHYPRLGVLFNSMEFLVPFITETVDREVLTELVKFEDRFPSPVIPAPVSV